MERLLFSDITEYNRRKRLLMNYQPHDIEGSTVINSYDLHQDASLSTANEDHSTLPENDREEVLDLTERTRPETSIIKGPTSKVGDVIKRPSTEGSSFSAKAEPIGPSVERIKVSRTSKLSRKKGIFLIIAPLSIVIMVILGYTTYLLLDEEADNGSGSNPISDFTISDSAPSSGTLVSLTAKSIETGTTYSWTIFPEDYSIRSGSVKERNIQLFFRKAGTYRVDLEVAFKGNKVSTNKFISVSERTFVISRERFSDKAGYNISGNLLIENIDSILRTKDMLSYKRMFLTYKTDGNDPALSTTGSELVNSKDGLGTEYPNLERGSVQNLRFEGYLERPNGMRSPLIGSSNIEQRTWIDIYNKRPTKMATSTKTDLQFQAIAGTTVDYRVNERGTIYNDLGSDLRELRVEDISEGRDMRVGMQGDIRWGVNDLEWEAIEVDIIGQRPALRLDLKLSTSDLKDLDLKEFGLSLWLSNDLPLAVRSVMNISSENDVATPYRLNHFQEMAFFEAGAKSLIYGDISTKHDMYVSADEVFPEISSEFHNGWTYVPDTGNMTSTIPTGFTAQDAISRFVDSPEFKAYKRSNPSLYGTISNYSSYGNKEQWRFSMAEKGDKLAWNQTVRRTEMDLGFPDDVEPVDLHRSDIGSILTYSGSEHCLKQLLTKLEQPYAILSFGKSTPSESDRIDTSGSSLETRVDMRYPMVGLINPGLIEKLPICFYVVGFDGSYKIGLDMTNGQLAFVTTTQVIKL
ncbi:MAG: hypothetical protein MUC62_07240 [Candidatus Thermoplasmatota archaeon]|nr:hypothetical protein [Candidatus Thermoplasmatota archaeon]